MRRLNYHISSSASDESEGVSLNHINRNRLLLYKSINTLLNFLDQEKPSMFT